MKPIMRLTAIVLFCLTAFTYNGFTQVTITQDDFPRQGSFIDTFVNASSSVIVAPTHGIGQVWDYSSATSGTPGIVTFTDASGDANFPNALNYRQRNLIFQSLLIESNEYESIDADGWYVLGRSITDVTYSISIITGGANDSLRFVGGNYIYPGVIDQLRFPVAYQNLWTLNYQQDNDFELTVASYGLNKVPGKLSRYFTQVREVVGEGTVIIPDINGAPSQPFDALLIRVVRTSIDSTFLGGAPAPPPLLTAFGLSQGSVAADSFYVIYAPGFGGPVLSMDINPGNQVSALVYRPSAARLGDPTSLEKLNMPTFAVAPNPVNAGSYLFIITETPHFINTLQLLSLNGQVISEYRLETQVEGNFPVLIPENTAAGVYLINLKDETGKIVASKGIHVNR